LMSIRTGIANVKTLINLSINHAESMHLKEMKAGRKDFLKHFISEILEPLNKWKSEFDEKSAMDIINPNVEKNISEDLGDTDANDLDDGLEVGNNNIFNEEFSQPKRNFEKSQLIESNLDSEICRNGDDHSGYREMDERVYNKLEDRLIEKFTQFFPQLIEKCMQDFISNGNQIGSDNRDTDRVSTQNPSRVDLRCDDKSDQLSTTNNE